MNTEHKVLAELTEDRYSSGEAISQKLNITRSAVWKHIVKLRERGYVIEALPRNGYRLIGRPDKLLPAEITPLIHAQVIGGHIVHFEKTGSTADDARKLIDEGAPEGTVVIADEQTQGRGRMGRTWQTPAGKAIALSVILHPRVSPSRISLLSLATALAVKNALVAVLSVTRESQSGEGGSEEIHVDPHISLKWPNDIYVGGKKLGGVLLEMAAELDRVQWAIASIGLNVNNQVQGTGLKNIATSLLEELGHEVSRRDLVVALLDELDSVYRRFNLEVDPGAISHEFEKSDMLQGHKVEVDTPAGFVTGVASGIDADGRLRIRESGGGVKLLFSGEATLSGAWSPP